MKKVEDLSTSIYKLKNIRNNLNKKYNKSYKNIKYCKDLKEFYDNQMYRLSRLMNIDLKLDSLLYEYDYYISLLNTCINNNVYYEILNEKIKFYN